MLYAKPCAERPRPELLHNPLPFPFRAQRGVPPRAAPSKASSIPDSTNDSPVLGSLNTIQQLTSSLHLILNPPRSSSHSSNKRWMSLVFNSGAKSESSRIRVVLFWLLERAELVEEKELECEWECECETTG